MKTSSAEFHRAQIQEELRSRALKKVDWSAYAKTPAEKKELKQAKKLHNKFCREQGINPKKMVTILKC